MTKKLMALMLVWSMIATMMVLPTGLQAAEEPGNVVVAQGFEDGLVGGWTVLPWGGTATLSVVSDMAGEGTKSLIISDRSARNSTPYFNLTSLGADKVFDISLKVRLGAGTDSYHLSSKIGAESLSNQYPWLAGSMTITADEWTTIEAKNVSIPADATEFMIWLEADGESTEVADIYLDDFRVVDVTPLDPGAPVETTLFSQDFEDGEVGNWTLLPWGGTGTSSVSTEVAAGGTKSLLISDRSARNASPYLNLSSLGADKVLNISLKVRLGAGTDSYHLSSKIGAESLSNQYPWLSGSMTITADEWTTIEAKNVTIPADATEFLIWLEADGESTDVADIYIDDFSVVGITLTQEEDDGRPEPKDFTMITFEGLEEGDLAGFVPRGGTETLTITDEANHTADGTKALKIEDRSENWHAPTLRVEEYIKKGYEYKITAWVKLLSPESAQLQLSTQVGNGDGASYNNIQGKTVTLDQGWVKLEGNYRYSSVGDEYVTIYVESSNSASAVYLMDDVSFEQTESGKVEVDKTLTPIKDVYADDFLIGNIVSAKEFEGQRLELLTHHFNVVTAENAMKPIYAYGSYPEFDLTAEDTLVDLVQGAGLDLVGHNLVWHQQSEDLLHTDIDGEPLTREEALENLTRHITTVVQHFGDKVISWDVVNEAMNDNPSNPTNWKGALRQSGWLRAIGDDYVEQAFLIARQALDDVGATDVMLYYNDYNDDNQNKAEAIYQMVKEINESYGATHEGKKLINGIGMQAHYNLNTNVENVEKSLLKFIEVTDEVSVTELDITAGSNNVISNEQAVAQGYLYAQLMNLYLEHADHIARVTFWGLDDATSWRADQNPLLFDGNLQAKLAYEAVIDPDTFLADHEPEEIIYKEGSAAYGTPTIDGTIDTVWSKATTLDINQYQLAWQGASGIAKVLWDQDNLYVLVTVTDSDLDKTSANPWEQDSVEIFVDQNNGKTSSYEGDDGQYRVNYDNEKSFNPGEPQGFASAVQVRDSHYTLELQIPLTSVTPANGTVIGFDVQINDGKDGQRQSVATWNDLKGTAYMDTSVFGKLTLNGKPTSNTNTTNPSGTNNQGTSSVVQTIEINDKDLALGAAENKVTVKLPMTTEPKVEVRIPVVSIAQNKTSVLEIANEQLAVQLPMTILGDQAKEVLLSVEKVDVKTLSKDLADKVGGFPVYDFDLAVDGIKKSKFEEPVTLSVAFDLEEGMDPSTIVVYYINDEGQLEMIKNGRYDAQTGMVTFSVNHFSYYTALERPVILADLEEDHWAQNALSYMVARDILLIGDQDKIMPDETLTRGELIELLVAALELDTNESGPGFKDLSSGTYAKAVLTAQGLGLVSGYGDGSFKGDQKMTREEFALILDRYLNGDNQVTPKALTLIPFEDEQDMEEAMADAINRLKSLGIINGYEGNLFKPKQFITKAEAAAMLNRILN